MARPIRVAQVVGNMETGGMQVLVMALMRGLDRSRFEPVLIQFKALNHFEEEIAREGWTCRTSPLRRSYKRGDIEALAQVLDEERIDLVHAHADFANFGARLAALRSGRPRHLLAHYHNTYEHRLDRKFLRRERTLSRWTDMILTCSEGVRQWLLDGFDLNGAPVRFVTNGVDLAPFQSAAARRAALRAASGVPADSFHVVHTARLEPHKAPDRILRALASDEGRLGEWALTYVGGGSLLGELKSLAESLGVAKRVRFVGWASSVAEHLAAADAFVLCSLNEGLSLCLVEALATRTPAIAPDIVGPREVLSHETNGLLVDVGDPQILLAALRRLREDDDFRGRLVEEGVRRAEDFAIANFLRQTEQAYDDALAAPPKLAAGKPFRTEAGWRLRHWRFRKGL